MSIYNTIDLYKKEIDKHRPFKGEMLNQIKAYYKIGLTWSSNALEGNTFTESETKVLLEDALSRSDFFFNPLINISKYNR